GSTAETFRPIIEAAGFSIVFVHNCEGRRTPYPRIYFIGIARRGEPPPAWASVEAMSALPPKAEIVRHDRDVRCARSGHEPRHSRRVIVYPNLQVIRN